MTLTRTGALAALALFALGFSAPGLTAQQHDHSQHAGHETRDIKALSPDDIAGLLNGDGMGFALPAELNHYPGPRHVIDLAQQLGLDEDQLVRVREIREDMQRRAIDAGRRYIEAERALDRFFADGGTDEARLRSLITEADRLRGAIRFEHLRAHLLTTRILTPEQISAYDRLRGYTGHAGHTGHDPQH